MLQKAPLQATDLIILRLGFRQLLNLWSVQHEMMKEMLLKTAVHRYAHSNSHTVNSSSDLTHLFTTMARISSQLIART